MNDSAFTQGRQSLTSVPEILPGRGEGAIGGERRAAMPTGKIKRLMKDRGFGFIRGNDGQEIFFHRSSLEGVPFESLSEGQDVDFEVEQSPKGPRAGKVRPAQG